MLVGYDIDGTLKPGEIPPPGSVVISGRTFAEYDSRCRTLAQHVPVYIRGSGAFGDGEHAGRFKALVINWLGVARFYEDDPRQSAIIRDLCPWCEVLPPCG